MSKFFVVMFVIFKLQKYLFQFKRQLVIQSDVVDESYTAGEYVQYIT